MVRGAIMDQLSTLLGILPVIFAIFWPGNRWLARRAIDLAVKRLPSEHREAYREEWYADLEAYAGGIWGLCWAIDHLRGADALAADLNRAETVTVHPPHRASPAGGPLVKLSNCMMCGRSLASSAKKCVHCGEDDPFIERSVIVGLIGSPGSNYEGFSGAPVVTSFRHRVSGQSDHNPITIRWHKHR